MKELLKSIIALVKLQHALFALPFTIAGMIMAGGGFPDFRVIFWILIAFLCARSFGMGMNRLVDREIDSRNPRTAHRLMASGRLGTWQVYPFLAFFLGLFILSAYMLNELCLKLLPLCLFVLVLYPYTKRFTVLAHSVLGSVLGLAPIGAWAAVNGSLHPAPVYLGLSILFWVNGFDVIYAIQDEEFDREEGLHSIPARLGKQGALKFALLCHLLVPIFWVVCGFSLAYGIKYFFGVSLLALLLFYEHTLVHRGYEKNLGLAFFKLNSTISLGFLVTILCEVFL